MPPDAAAQLALPLVGVPPESGTPVVVQPKPRELTKADLKRRGWTDTAVAMFLGEPDRHRHNPLGRHNPICLFATARVLEAEMTAAFVMWKRGRDRRGERARRAAQRQAEALADRLRRWEPKIVCLPLEVVRRASVEAYNQYLDARALRGEGEVVELPPPADAASPPPFLDRIAVNYIRHRLTAYDAQLAAMVGQVGGEEASLLVKRRVFEAIAVAYPELADEAHRQLERRCGPR
jgi:hypothetical protein